MCIYLYVYLSLCICVCVRICICVCVCMYSRTSLIRTSEIRTSHSECVCCVCVCVVYTRLPLSSFMVCLLPDCLRSCLSMCGAPPPPTTYVLYEHAKTITIHNSSRKMLYFSRLFISSTLGATCVFVLFYVIKKIMIAKKKIFKLYF